MKFKKLLISASVVAASSGLLATILTSCAKANIDKDLKIDLDKDGNYVTEIIDGNFKTAAKEALKLSSN
ncbi:MAG: hypothetical protein MJ200_03955 [Mycoplasmoidaceae bacterium]|nr:hypothetical protein [Mycoplasmoidaceae bacterium]